MLTVDSGGKDNHLQRAGRHLALGSTTWRRSTALHSRAQRADRHVDKTSGMPELWGYSPAEILEFLTGFAPELRVRIFQIHPPM